MRLFNFNQTGGFKLVTDILTKIQTAYSIYNGVAKMAGDKSILSGCEDLGTSVGDGYVVINGELLEFKGALKQATVIIKEEITQADYEDGSLKDFENYRYATFGFSGNAANWDEFKRVPALNTLPTLISNVENTLNTKIDALANAIGFMRKGSIFIGDINAKSVGWLGSGDGYSVVLMNTGTDELYRVTFTNPLETSEYRVYTSMHYSGNYVFNNDVISATANKTVNGFDLTLREVSPDVQNLTVEYIIFKK